MRKAIKNQGKTVLAYELGAGSAIEQQLISAGKIQVLEDGSYGLFSQEAVNGEGQRASAGDYFKLDSTGAPYPNQRQWFLDHHRHLQGDEYEQCPQPVDIWQTEDGPCPEIQFLLDQGLLRINTQDADRYFNAELWGAPLSAKKDAVVVFYSLDRDGTDFNFVAWEEFQKTYHIL
jgi:hypothetical protein